MRMTRRSSPRGGGAAGSGRGPRDGSKSTPGGASKGPQGKRGPKPARPGWMPEPIHSAGHRGRGAAPTQDPQAQREAAKYEKPIAKAAFGEKPPASTLVEVSKLVDPD